MAKRRVDMNHYTALVRIIYMLIPTITIPTASGS